MAFHGAGRFFKAQAHTGLHRGWGSTFNGVGFRLGGFKSKGLVLKGVSDIMVTFSIYFDNKETSSQDSKPEDVLVRLTHPLSSEARKAKKAFSKHFQTEEFLAELKRLRAALSGGW